MLSKMHNALYDFSNLKLQLITSCEFVNEYPLLFTWLETYVYCLSNSGHSAYSVLLHNLQYMLAIFHNQPGFHGALTSDVDVGRSLTLANNFYVDVDYPRPQHMLPQSRICSTLGDPLSKNYEVQLLVVKAHRSSMNGDYHGLGHSHFYPQHMKPSV